MKNLTVELRLQHFYVMNKTEFPFAETIHQNISEIWFIFMCHICTVYWT